MNEHLGSDQRLTIRKALRCTATLTLGQGNLVIGKTTDISETGLCVLIPLTVSPGQQGLIEFIAFCGSERVAVRVNFIAVYCVLKHDDFKVGVQFVHVSAATREAIARLCR